MKSQSLHRLKRKSLLKLKSLVIVTNVVPISSYEEILGYRVQFILWPIKYKKGWMNFLWGGEGGIGFMLLPFTCS